MVELEKLELILIVTSQMVELEKIGAAFEGFRKLVEGLLRRFA